MDTTHTHPAMAKSALVAKGWAAVPTNARASTQSGVNYLRASGVSVTDATTESPSKEIKSALDNIISRITTPVGIWASKGSAATYSMDTKTPVRSKSASYDDSSLLSMTPVDDRTLVISIGAAMMDFRTPAKRSNNSVASAVKNPFATDPSAGNVMAGHAFVDATKS